MCKKKKKKELFIRLLSERRFKELKEDLMTMKAVDIASLLSQLDDKEIAIVFSDSFQKIRLLKFFF